MAHPQDPNAPNPGSDSTIPGKPTPNDPAQETENESVQAVVFHTSHFHSTDECITWLEENGYASDNLIPGDEANDPFIAVQFEAEQCEPDTARRDQVEDGVELVCCVREADEDEEPETPTEGEDHEEQPQLAGAKGTVNRAAEPNVGDPVRGMENNSPAETEEPEQESKGKPHAAEVLETMHGHLCAARQYMNEAMPDLDHNLSPKIHKAFGKVSDKLNELREHVKAAALEHYPEQLKDVMDNGDVHFQESVKPEEEEEAEGGEDHQTPQGEVEDERLDDEKKPTRKPKKSAAALQTKLARKDVNTLADTKDFLEELAGEENLKKSQKAACKLHAQDLGSLCQKFSESTETAEKVAPAPVTAMTSNTSLDKQIAEYQRIINEMSEAIYAATGQEV